MPHQPLLPLTGRFWRMLGVRWQRRPYDSGSHLTGGRWNYSVIKPDGVICGDGNYADVVIRYSVDAGTLAGTVTADSNGECPGGQVTQVPIQLTQVG